MPISRWDKKIADVRSYGCDWLEWFPCLCQDMTFDAEVKTLLAELLASKLELWNLSCSAAHVLFLTPTWQLWDGMALCQAQGLALESPKIR